MKKNTGVVKLTVDGVDTITDFILYSDRNIKRCVTTLKKLYGEHAITAPARETNNANKINKNHDKHV